MDEDERGYRLRSEMFREKQPSRTAGADAFHAHLDACAQCERQPFALCSVGLQLLRAIGPKGT